MDLERVSAELRPRSSFEAMDLGFALARVYARPLYGAWLLLSLPVILGISLGAVTLGMPWLAPLGIWGCKPLLDRVPLFVLSRALFGDAPELAETVRAAPGLWWRRLLYGLFIARLDLSRAFVEPIYQLEGQRGMAARRRRRVLGQGTFGASVALFSVAHLLEWVVMVGVVVFAAMLLPDTPTYAGTALWSSFWNGTAPAWFQLLVPMSYGLAVLLVEPLYVASGFALYLNRRTGLEGWDVEVAFRRLAGRLVVAARVGLALLLLFAAAGAGHAAAPATETGPVTPERSVSEVLARPEFPHTETTSHWKWRFEDAPQADLPIAPLGLFGGLFANALEVLLWVALAVAVVALVAVLLRTRGASNASEKPEKAAAPVLGIGLDLRPESLPRNIADVAWALWQEGRRFEAVALLYRGALVDLITQRQMSVEDGATERDCLRLAGPLLDARGTGYFARLTAVWQEAAYAHRFPAEEAAVSLCRRWPDHFRGVA